VWETLYFANLFKIKLKVTLNIGVTEVLPHNFYFQKKKKQKTKNKKLAMDSASSDRFFENT
jgi:hypothetical protein